MTPEERFGHEQPLDPTQRFNDAVNSVKTYNQRNTGLPFALKGMLSWVLPKDELQVSQEEKSDMEKELVQLIQADELENMGIKLLDSRSDEIEETDADEDQKPRLPSLLVMVIGNKDDFINTIYQLNPSEEQEDETLENMSSVLSSVIAMIQAAYKLSDDADADRTDVTRIIVEDQLDTFMELSPALAEQGFGKTKAYELLAEYSARHLSGCLEEYCEAEELGLLTDGFGPARWVKDMSADVLNERWESAFGLLQRMHSQEEQSPFFEELFNKLRADFDTADQWLKTIKTYDSSKHPLFPKPEGYSLAYVNNLQAEMNRLLPRWEELFPLENSFYLTEKSATNN